MPDGKGGHQDQNLSPLTDLIGCAKSNHKQEVVATLKVGNVLYAELQINKKLFQKNVMSGK